MFACQLCSRNFAAEYRLLAVFDSTAGVLPASLGKLHNLKVLNVESNQLQGEWGRRASRLYDREFGPCILDRHAFRQFKASCSFFRRGFACRTYMNLCGNDGDLDKEMVENAF